VKDGRGRGHETCGVWIPAEQKFCEEPVLALRRCRRHYDNLKKDDLWRSLQRMEKEQRERSLDMLDDVQKHREPWTYRNDEGERQLIAEQERDANR
jgi:hypothetical protein